MWYSTIISRGKKTSLLVLKCRGVCGPELESSLEAEEVLIVSQMGVRQDTQSTRAWRGRRDQSESIVGRRACNWEAVNLSVDRSGRDSIVSNGIGLGRGRDLRDPKAGGRRGRGLATEQWHTAWKKLRGGSRDGDGDRQE